MVEAFGPEALIAVEPLVGFFHGLGAQPAGDGAAGFVAGHKASIRQHVEMLHHGRQRHRERLREFADGQVRTRGQTCKERTPSWVSQRGEGAVQCVFLKLNHEVNYRDS